MLRLHPERKQDLAQAAKDIEQNMPLGDRLLTALRVGGTEALKQTLNHPAATFVLALIDDWKKLRIKKINEVKAEKELTTV